MPRADARRRPRRESLKVDKQDIVARVLDFYERDLRSRDVDREARIQRYAKFRMWTEPKEWPWPDAANIGLPDMTEKSLKLQDTLHNAVMATRPPIGSQAQQPADREKERTIDSLIDFQFFEEAGGENIVGDMADAFINDGVVTVFTPWVREMRDVVDRRMFDPIPPDLKPEEYFRGLLRQQFPNAILISKENGWEWDVMRFEGSDERESFRVSFFTTKDEQVEMLVRAERIVYDGPRPIVKDYEDVLYPVRSANLQIPGPSNPNGAPHVILIDHPTIDEIKRLRKSGFYDLLTKEDAESLENLTRSGADEDEKDQKDTLDGKSEEKRQDKARSHTRLTRLTCFDVFDIDGDGIDEDVIWWVIKEQKTLVKARMLTEMYPADPPRRPFSGNSFIPIRGRYAGMSLLEILEGVHDAMKALMDQSVDHGTIKNVPFFFYRASGGVRQEVIRLAPGEGYPLADPSRDVNFPQMGDSQGLAFSLNLVTMLGQMEERLSEIGDLQLGRVPPGKSTALRNFRSMALLAGQAEARPERILRRFFTAISEVWAQIHELNQAFLPKGKQFRISGVKSPNEDPYLEIANRDEISGRFRFTFGANVLNTSKQALQGSLGALMQVYVSDLLFRLGIIDADGVYRLMRDFGRAFGQDPDQYIKKPNPRASARRIQAEDAISQILNSGVPEGEPAEGPQEHLEKLGEFFQSDNFGLLTPDQVEIFKDYVAQVQERAAEAAQQAQLAQAAQQFAAGMGGGQPGRPAEQVGSTAPAPQGPGELIDESLPGAGGGTVQ